VLGFAEGEGINGLGPVDVIAPETVVLTPVEGLVNLCPATGGLLPGLANLGACPAVPTMDGELVLSPEEVIVGPDVGGILGVLLRGVPEGLTNL